MKDIMRRPNILGELEEAIETTHEALNLIEEWKRLKGIEIETDPKNINGMMSERLAEILLKGIT